jgi:hypothetical protein
MTAAHMVLEPRKTHGQHVKKCPQNKGQNCLFEHVDGYIYIYGWMDGWIYRWMQSRGTQHDMFVHPDTRELAPPVAPTLKKWSEKEGGVVVVAARQVWTSSH